MISGCSAGASTAMKRAGITTLALWLALTGAWLPAVRSAPRLALELQDYAARNGVFYTLHMEDPATPGPAEPRSGVVPGLDLSGYTTTIAVTTPTVEGRIDREVVLVEWNDRNIANTTFEGTARELLRVQHPLAPHPLGEMTFNPVARAGDPDWRVIVPSCRHATAAL